MNKVKDHKWNKLKEYLKYSEKEFDKRSRYGYLQTVDRCAVSYASGVIREIINKMDELEMEGGE